MTTDAGTVLTVLGPVPADTLGRTLMHEHLLFNLETYLHQPPDPADAPLVEAPLTLDTLWWVHEHPMASRQNFSGRSVSSHERLERRRHRRDSCQLMLVRCSTRAGGLPRSYRHRSTEPPPRRTIP